MVAGHKALTLAQLAFVRVVLLRQLAVRRADRRVVGAVRDVERRVRVHHSPPAKEITVNHTEAPGFLYIANATPNIGYGPIDIFGVDSCYCGTTLVPCGTVCPNGDDIKHLVKQRIYQKVPGTDTLTYYDREAGKMTYHAAHGHLHVDHWSNYTLRNKVSVLSILVIVQLIPDNVSTTTVIQ